MKFEVTTTQVQEVDPRLHFADEATPPEAGGPGALIVNVGSAVVRIPATEPIVVALVDRIKTELSGNAAVREKVPAVAEAGGK
jgi:hypothetical protein